VSFGKKISNVGYYMKMDAKVWGEVGALLLHGPKKLFGHASLLGVQFRMPVAGVVVV